MKEKREEKRGRKKEEEKRGKKKRKEKGFQSMSESLFWGREEI